MASESTPSSCASFAVKPPLCTSCVTLPEMSRLADKTFTLTSRLDLARRRTLPSVPNTAFTSNDETSTCRATAIALVYVPLALLNSSSETFCSRNSISTTAAAVGKIVGEAVGETVGDSVGMGFTTAYAPSETASRSNTVHDVANPIFTLGSSIQEALWPSCAALFASVFPTGTTLVLSGIAPVPY